MSAEQEARWNEIKEGFLRVQRLGGKDDDPVARVTGTLGGLDVQLRGIRDTLARAVAAEKPASADSLTSGLKELTASLERLSRPKLEVSLSEPTNPALALVERQLEVMERLLEQSGGSAGHALEALTRAVGDLQRSLPLGLAPIRTIAVTLAAHSASNLFRAVSSLDVCSNGGIFVATYEKPPALGTPLVVSLTFPAAEPCEVRGTVAFVQEAFGDDSASGYGVRFSDVTEAARALIEEYAAQREPLLRDDG
jgi:Tfp pilus assembly protein PilZ